MEESHALCRLPERVTWSRTLHCQVSQAESKQLQEREVTRHEAMIITTIRFRFDVGRRRIASRIDIVTTA